MKICCFASLSVWRLIAQKCNGYVCCTVPWTRIFNCIYNHVMRSSWLIVDSKRYEIMMQFLWFLQCNPMAAIVRFSLRTFLVFKSESECHSSTWTHKSVFSATSSHKTGFNQRSHKCSPFDTFASTFNPNKWSTNESLSVLCRPFPAQSYLGLTTTTTMSQLFSLFRDFHSLIKAFLCHQKISELRCSVHSSGKWKRARRMIAFRSSASPFHNFFHFFWWLWLRLILNDVDCAQRTEKKNRKQNE